MFLILMGYDSNRWVSVIFTLLILSFVVSCKSSNPRLNMGSTEVVSSELQIDGYGHIDDTLIVDVTNEPLTCEILDEEPAQHLCNDGKIWICHVPPGNPLNSHMIKVSINALTGHANHSREYTVPCSDEYFEGQNCPLMDCEFEDPRNDEEDEDHGQDCDKKKCKAKKKKDCSKKKKNNDDHDEEDEHDHNEDNDEYDNY